MRPLRFLRYCKVKGFSLNPSFLLNRLILADGLSQNFDSNIKQIYAN